jgi:hypothetical protein
VDAIKKTLKKDITVFVDVFDSRANYVIGWIEAERVHDSLDFGQCDGSISVDVKYLESFFEYLKQKFEIFRYTVVRNSSLQAEGIRKENLR